MKGILRSLLFLAACPLVLIMTTAFVTTTSFANTIKVGAIACVATYGLTLLFLQWDGWKLSDAGLALTPKTLPLVLLGLMIGSALVAFQEALLYASGHVHWAYNGIDSPMRRLLLALTSYLLLALREEIAFRAYPLRCLEQDVGMWASLVILGLAFTLEHRAGGLSWSLSLVGPLAGAILFGMAALATRGIAVPFGIHFAFNLGQWAMGQKESAGLWRTNVDPTFQKQADAVGYAGFLLGALAVTFCFWLHHRRCMDPIAAQEDRNP